MTHNFFFSMNSVNLVKWLLYAKQAVSNTRLTNSYLSAHYVPDCCDAKGCACKVLVLVFTGWHMSPAFCTTSCILCHQAAFRGDKTILSLTSAFSQSLWHWNNAHILKFHCILENVLPVAMSISWRKLKLLTFYIVQSRYCCCWQKPSQAASAKRCESSGTENVLSEASETHGLGEFLK